MRIFELYYNPAEGMKQRQQIVGIVGELKANNDWDTLEQISHLFASFKYRDDREGLLRGIPFSTSPNDLNTTLGEITAQGDEMATKRLLRRILELING